MLRLPTPLSSSANLAPLSDQIPVRASHSELEDLQYDPTAPTKNDGRVPRDAHDRVVDQPEADMSRT